MPMSAIFLSVYNLSISIKFRCMYCVQVSKCCDEKLQVLFGKRTPKETAYRPDTC